MAEKVDVVVIGAGAIGCSIAYYLAKEGIKVALLERESFGSGSTAHATGVPRSGWLWKKAKKI